MRRLSRPAQDFPHFSRERIHDVARALRYDAVHGCQPQPRPLPGLLGREEGFEDLGENVLLHSVTSVADGQHHVGTGLDPGARSGIGRVQVDVGALDCEAATSGHGVPRVHGQVHEDLLDLPGISLDLAHSRPGDAEVSCPTPPRSAYSGLITPTLTANRTRPPGPCTPRRATSSARA